MAGLDLSHIMGMMNMNPALAQGIMPGEMAGMPAAINGAMPQINVPRVNPNQSMMADMSRVRMMRSLMGMDSMAQHMSGGGRTGGRGGYGMPGMDLSTGIDPSTMDQDRVNQLLGQFGESMPQNPNPYAFFQNSGFMGRHPGVAGGIENALFAAANTGPADSWGEGVSQVARGLLGGRAERSRVINSQFQQPFAAASMLSGLQHQYDVHEEDLQRARLIENQADYMGDKENIEYAKVNAANNRAYLQAQTKLTNEQAAQTAREGRIPPTIFSEFKAMGLEDPYGMNEGEGPTPDQWNTAQNRIYQRQLGRAAVGPNISQRGADNRQAKSFAHSDQAANIKREQMPLKMNFTQKRDFGKTIGKKASEVTSQDIINYNRSVADHYRQDFDSQYVDSDASPSTNPMPGPSKTPKSTPKKIYVEGKDF